MSKKRKNICKTCNTFFNDVHIHELEEGECRKYAPRVVHGSGTGWSDTRFPTVDFNDWCGEHSDEEKKENG